MDLEKNHALYRKIKLSVSQTTPQLAGELDKILTEYHGDAKLLDEFLKIFGSESSESEQKYNPWLASKNAVLKRALFRTKGDDIKAISKSGHHLKDQLFYMEHKHDPTRNWTSGAVAITRIMEAFGTDEQKLALTSEGQEEIIKKKKAQSKRTLDDLASTLEEILSDPARIKNVQSVDDRTKIQHILGLDDELRKRIMLLDRIVYGNTAFSDETSKTNLLVSEPKGQLFTWFGKKINELPQGIKDIYTTLKNPAIEISESERRFMFGSLIAYASANMPINREAAIGGYQEDLEFLLNLPDDNPIIKKFGRPDLHKVRSVLSKNEITLIDATRIFDIHPVDQAREEMNKQTLDYFTHEYDEAVKSISPLLIKEGKWMEDSIGSSMPNRLKNTIYSAILIRDDFESVKKILRLITLSQSKNRMYKSMPIEEFNALARRVALTAREIDYLEDVLNEKNIVVQDRSDAKDIVDMLKPKLRGEYGLAEDFAEVNGRTIDMIIDVYEKRKDNLNPKEWAANKDEIIKLAKHKIYKKTKEFERITDIVKDYKKISEIKEYESAKNALNHPLTISAGPMIYIPEENKVYASKTELESIVKLSNSARLLPDVKSEEENDLRKLAAKARTGRFYKGSVKGRVTIYSASPIKGDETIRYLDVDAEKEFVPLASKELGVEFVDKLRYLTSFKAKKELERTGMICSDRESWIAAENMTVENTYVHKNLVSDVEEVYAKIKKV